MKITIVAAGSQGDIQPCVALARGLQQAGYRVCLAAPEDFAGFVQKHGIEFRPVHGDVQQIMASDTGRKFMETGGANPLKSIRYLRTLVAPVALPLADEVGRAIGSFEMALEFGPLLDELKRAYGFELALFINEKILHETATSLKGDIFNEQNRVGPYVKFYSTHPELLRTLVGSGDINITEDAHYLREANGVPHGVLLQPIYNYAKKQIGVVAMARDFSATRLADGQAVVWQTLLGVLSAMLLAGAILVVLRGMVTRPLAVLNERIAAMADGAPERELSGAPGWCDEMRELAQSCERLANQAPADKPAAGDAS